MDQSGILVRTTLALLLAGFAVGCGDANRNRSSDGAVTRDVGADAVADASGDDGSPGVDGDIADVAPDTAAPDLPCHPLTQVGCSGGEACYYDPAMSALACSVAGTEDVGAFCDEETGCLGGLLCGNGMCQQICTLGDGSECSGGTSCIPTQFPATSFPFGVCVGS
jgi:hypothetical protein